MKIFLVLSISLLISVSFAGRVFSQDDESRQQSGLPTFIGPRPGSNSQPGSDGTLSGSFTVQGLVDSVPEPTFTVAVLANGSLVSRQRVKNRGSFSFNSVPRVGVSLIVEIDGLEISNYQIGVLNPPPLSNRQEVMITWVQVGQAIKQKNEILSVRNAYSRTEGNQKAFENALSLLKNKKMMPLRKN